MGAGDFLRPDFIELIALDRHLLRRAARNWLFPIQLRRLTFGSMAEGRRIWPRWARTVGEMIRHSAIVRVHCLGCDTFFDVDLPAIARTRGANHSLVDATTGCKITRCRGRGYFVAAPVMDGRFLLLVNPSMDALRARLEALRPIDIEPPDGSGSAPAAAMRAVA
jgi:hypothetical protein